MMKLFTEHSNFDVPVLINLVHLYYMHHKKNQELVSWNGNQLAVHMRSAVAFLEF